jgi:uncharacterized protein (DUF2384 family)
MAIQQQTASPGRVRERMHLSRERFSRLFPVSAKTIERWEGADALPGSDPLRGRLAELDRISELGLVVFTADGFARFLSLPSPALVDRTPLQLLEGGEGARVLALLASLHEGSAL